MIHDFSELKEALTGKNPLSLAIVSANDPDLLDAALESARAGWTSLILIGQRSGFGEKNFQGCRRRFIEEPDPLKAALIGAELLAGNEADLIMKGEIPTADFLKPLLPKGEKINGRDYFFSHVAFFSLPGRERLTALSDAAVNIGPDLPAKEEILKNALKAVTALGYNPPKVAVLSAIEKVNPKIPSSVEAAELREFGEKLGGMFISGPLALDNALCGEAAAHKGLENDPVAGKADLLIVPELVSGNILYKSFSLIAGFPTAGVVIGAEKPIIVTSRADRPGTKVNSIALACFLRHKGIAAPSLKGMEEGK
ncbi:MAG: phosphate acyltransferase [Bacteroidota bacterium]